MKNLFHKMGDSGLFDSPLGMRLLRVWIDFFPLYDSSQRFHPSFHFFWHLNFHYLSPLNNYYNSAFTPYLQLGELLKIYQVNITYCYKWSHLDHGTHILYFLSKPLRKLLDRMSWCGYCLFSSTSCMYFLSTKVNPDE